ERRPTAVAAIAAAIDRLRAQVLDISGTLPSTNPASAWWMPPRSTSTFRFLGSALGNLAAAVDGSDNAPSADAQDGYAKLAPMVEARVRSWEALKSGDLAKLNSMLEAAQQKPIDLRPEKK